ncbi:MAG: glycosyltransferase [Thiobacillus sp.]
MRAAVESVLGQTYGNLELIAIDAASPDATWEVLQLHGDERLRCSVLALRTGLSKINCTRTIYDKHRSRAHRSAYPLLQRGSRCRPGCVRF